MKNGKIIITIETFNMCMDDLTIIYRHNSISIFEIDIQSMKNTYTKNPTQTHTSIIKDYMEEKQSHGGKKEREKTNKRTSERVNESFQMQTYSPTDTHLPMISLENEMQDDDDDDGGKKRITKNLEFFNLFFFGIKNIVILRPLCIILLL